MGRRYQHQIDRWKQPTHDERQRKAAVLTGREFYRIPSEVRYMLNEVGYYAGYSWVLDNTERNRLDRYLEEQPMNQHRAFLQINDEYMKSLPEMIRKYIEKAQISDPDPDHKIIYPGGPIYKVNAPKDEWAALMVLTGLEQRDTGFHDSTGNMVAGEIWIHVRDMHMHLQEQYHGE